jgi:hypothetical protein
MMNIVSFSWSMSWAFVKFGLLLMLAMTMKNTSTMACPSSITEIACNSNTTDFETLCDLLDLAGLSTMLDEEAGGPFTVFAPLDSAFEVLDTAIVEMLINNTGKVGSCWTSKVLLLLLLLSLSIDVACCDSSQTLCWFPRL